jgi:hypothetical protein
MWSWTSFGLGWALLMTLVVRLPVRWSPLEALTAGGLACLAAWTLASATWSADSALSVRESERALLYLIGLVAVLVLAEGRRPVRALLAGVVAAIGAITSYALLHYLFPSGPRTPDVFEGYLLFEPIGYANALGILTVIGVLLGLGFVFHGATAGVRTGCAALLVPLVSALQLTSSRASWLALGAGLGVAIALERERVRMLVTLLLLAPAPALAVWLSWRAHLPSSSPPFAADRAKHLAVAIILLTAATAALSRVAIAIGPRLRLSRRSMLIGGGTAIVGALALVLLVARPLSAHAPPSPHRGDRADYWRVAWQEWEDHRALGSGAGTFRHFWQQQPTNRGALDAHSLYLEALAELGPLGLALVLVSLGLPLAAAVKARGHPLVPAALGAYVAYLLHAGLDWDWEMPVVTLAALFCGASLLIAARRPGETAVSERTRMVALAAAAGVVVVACVELVANGAIRA